MVEQNPVFSKQQVLLISQWFIIPIVLFLLQLKVAYMMDLNISSKTGILNLELVWFTLLFNVLNTIVLWITEYRRDKVEEWDWTHIFPYILPYAFLFLIAFTLLLSNIKRVNGMGGAPENTLNLIIWLSIFFIIIQLISKRYFYIMCNTEEKKKSFTNSLYRSWVPITGLGIITLIFLAYILMKNNIDGSKLISFFIPLMFSLMLAVGGILWTNEENQLSTKVDLEDDEE